MHKNRQYEKQDGSDANGEWSNEINDSVREIMNQGAFQDSEAKCMIPKMIECLQALMEEQNVGKCPLTKLLDDNGVFYEPAGQWYEIPLINGKHVWINPKTGEHRYRSMGPTYSQTKLTEQGWADFLARHKLIPLLLASQEEQEKLRVADRWYWEIIKHLEETKLPYTEDEISRHIFVTPFMHRQFALTINCMKQFVRSRSPEHYFDFEGGEYKEIIQLLIEDAA